MRGRQAKYDWARCQRLNDKCAIVLRELVARDGPLGAFPSQKRLSLEANGMNISSVKRCLDEIELLGLIVRGRIRLPGRPGQPSHVSCVYFPQYQVTVQRPKGISWKAFIASHKARTAIREPQEGDVGPTTAEGRRRFVERLLEKWELSKRFDDEHEE